jgi:molybdopterin molybdotransferase
LVRPALLKMMGANEKARDLTRVQAKTTQDLANDGDRVHYLRGRYECGEFVPVGRQESHALFGLSRSNALARVDTGETIKAGQTVTVDLWE